MTSNWREVHLEDVADELTVGFVGSMVSEYVDSGIPFLRSLNIEPYEIKTKDIKYISSDFHEKISKSRLTPGDVVIIRTGRPGACTVIPSWLSEANCSDLVIIRPGKELDSHFLAAYINTVATQYIYSHLVGAVQQHFNVGSARKLKIVLPPLEEQKSIAKILKRLNEKVDTNKSIIKTLEDIAQTIFKRWFEEFEFPNENGEPYKSSGGEMEESNIGLIPEGWEVKPLDKIANFTNGLAMQKFRPKEMEGSLPVLKIKELRQGRTDANSDRCSVNIKDTVKIFDGDVIFSWSATLLVKLWSGGNAGLNQHLFKVTSDEYPKWFYYHWTKSHLEQFKSIASDKATTMGHINRSHLSKSKVVIPDQNQMEKFTKYFSSLTKLVIEKKLENHRLVELRDTILPKLLSGEIELPEANEVTENVPIS